MPRPARKPESRRMPTMPDNPRAKPGDNRPPEYAKEVTERMAADYAALAETITLQLTEARKLPDAVEDEGDLAKFSDVVVRLRDSAARAESSRVAEKEPYLRAGQAVDGFFKGLMDRANKGCAVLTRKVNDYQLRKLAEERLKRERERAQAERLEQARRKEAEAAAREAEAAQYKAERAKRDQEVKLERALDAAARADASQIDARMASDLADAARLAAAQSPAAMARTRFEETGRLVTVRQVGFAEVTDESKLDALALWPFVPSKIKAQALREWARAKDFKAEMPGAAIGLRDESVIR